MSPRHLPLAAIAILLTLLPFVRPDTQIQRRITAPVSQETSLALIDDSPVSLGTRTLGQLAHLAIKAVNWSMVAVGYYKLFGVLRQFLGKILDSLLNEWAKSPPSNQVVIEAGRLRLEFGCASEPVPWEYVEDFTRSKQDAVDRGFAEVRSQEWIWLNGDKSRRCYAGMRVAREGEDVIPPKQEEIAA